MLFAAGFRAASPNYEAILQDMRSPPELPMTAGALVLWGVSYGLRAGDVIEIRITKPDGTIFLERRFRQEKTQIRGMRFAGRRNTGGTLKAGGYTGTVRIYRQTDTRGQTMVEKTVEVQLRK